MQIERTFQNISEEDLDKADQQSYLVSLGWARGTDWEELLLSKRILIISETGAGKTYECETQCKRLWDSGEPAFHLDLATLVRSYVRDMLEPEKESRFDHWLTAQSDVATFFLDSIDELKLSGGKFRNALIRLAKSCAGQLGRMRIVITTRPIPFDERAIREILPVPKIAEIQTSPDGETFAQIALHGRSNKAKSDQKDSPPDWRTVALMPLSDAQITDFSIGQGVNDPKALLEDLQRRNAQEFARRPQDLIELCADWRDFKRIRTHREQVASNVRIKLKPREDRQEPAALSVDKAIEGASRLALAMMGTRRLTIRHSAEADSGGDDVPLDPAVILADWPAPERQALLQRALFGFASYGRVRFHHRSVAEYLAAERIKFLRKGKMTARALKRLLFAETRGKTIVRPSKRPIAGWLALTEDMVFESLRDHEPAVLLTEGDPESLSPFQRIQALGAYVERYGKGGWCGLSVPHIQIHRFASPELAPEIKRLWAHGIENSEVREILLNLIEVGRITECLDIAYGVAQDAAAPHTERFDALEALASANDARLESIIAEMADNTELWPDDLAKGLIYRLFPKHLQITQLCRILARLKGRKQSISELSRHLPSIIAGADLDAPKLEDLRDGLYKLASAGLKWQDGWPHIVSNRSDLGNALAATCVCGLNIDPTTAWLRASVLALRLPHKDHGSDEAYTQLKKLLDELPAENNAKLFWAEDALIQSIHTIDGAWERYYEIVGHGAVQIKPTRDLGWIKEALSDSTRSSADRAMLLEAAMRHAPSQEEWRDHIIGLKVFVTDTPKLIEVIEERLKPRKPNKEHLRWERENAERTKKQEKEEAENRASWVKFWRDVANHPEDVFSPERSGNTVWHLWHAMCRAGDENRASGWNPRFIEAQFGKETVERVKRALIEQWRKDRPTLRSERPNDAKGTFLTLWQLGLAGIYAEAEDEQWAAKLSHEEAELAARFATIELNSLPLWIEALVKAHPSAVEATLGKELRLELEEEMKGSHWYSMLLQNIEHTSKSVIEIFLPDLRKWLNTKSKSGSQNADATAQRIEQVDSFVIKHGDEEDRAQICEIAKERLGKRISEPLVQVWLPVLMRLDPCSGVDVFERKIASIRPTKRSKAVTWFATIIGDRNDGIDLTAPRFTPQILLRLLRLAYHHIRPADDAKHDGCYSPDVRDNAETARSWIVNALLKVKGEEGWAVKLEMANDPICADFKDRIIALAEEQWAEEIDGFPLNEAQTIALDKVGEAPPSTNEAMFSIMVDRLDDISELLKNDFGPREAWAEITQERIMRREIARALSLHANGHYKIGQEGVTADEKETDIRLTSTISPHEAVIELKLAGKKYTAKDLLDTLETQLVKKYLAPETRRSGCLLITLSKNRFWYHPDTRKKLDLTDLIDLLRKEADRIMEKYGGSLRLHVCALDLRPRLPTENGVP